MPSVVPACLLSCLLLVACSTAAEPPIEERIASTNEWIAEQRALDLTAVGRQGLDALERELVSLRMMLETADGQHDPRVESAIQELEDQLAELRSED